MSTWQKMFVLGYVGGDPRLDTLRDGTQVSSFSVAVTDRWRDGNVERERTTWFKVVVWRDQAAHIARYVRKGMRVLVEGRIDCEAYSDKNGKPVAALKLVAADVRFLSPVSEDGRLPGDVEAVNPAEAVNPIERIRQDSV